MFASERPFSALGLDHTAARPSSRRSTLKSIHWIDLPGFAGRVSPQHGHERGFRTGGEIRGNTRAGRHGNFWREGASVDHHLIAGPKLRERREQVVISQRHTALGRGIIWLSQMQENGAAFA